VCEIKLQDPSFCNLRQAELPRSVWRTPREHERVTAIIIFIFNRKTFYSERFNGCTFATNGKLNKKEKKDPKGGAVEIGECATIKGSP